MTESTPVSAWPANASPSSETLQGREAAVPPAPPREREVFDSWECAGFLGVSVQVVRREWRLGKLPGRKVGRSLRFLRSDVEHYLRSGQPDPDDADDDEA